MLMSEDEKARLLFCSGNAATQKMNRYVGRCSRRSHDIDAPSSMNTKACGMGRQRASREKAKAGIHRPKAADEL